MRQNLLHIRHCKIKQNTIFNLSGNTDRRHTITGYIVLFIFCCCVKYLRFSHTRYRIEKAEEAMKQQRIVFLLFHGLWQDTVYFKT